MERLQNEYLAATLRPNEVYTVTEPAVRQGADGAPEPFERVTTFKVIDVVTTRTRPTLMPTVVSADDIVLAAPLAMYVQVFDVWAGDAYPGPDLLHVFAEADPEWVQPARLASWEAMSKSMNKMDDGGGFSGRAECVRVVGQCCRPPNLAHRRRAVSCTNARTGIDRTRLDQ